MPPLILLSKSSQSHGNRNGDSLGTVNGQSKDVNGHFIVTASAVIPEYNNVSLWGLALSFSLGTLFGSVFYTTCAILEALLK